MDEHPPSSLSEPKIGQVAPTVIDEAEALALDRADPLSAYRARFELPHAADGTLAIYVCGHSMGALPRAAREAVEAELDAWSRLGVEGHFRPDAPWFTYSDLFAEPTARLVGARPTEVVTMNTLSINLHTLFASLYRPTRDRYKVLIEDGAFPSDRYAVVAQLRWRGIDPADALVVARPREGEDTLRTEDLEALIARHAPSIALTWLPGVQYLTGQLLEMERITAAAHAAGALAGWDLAHAAGNVPLRLHDWGVDLAVWCSYKYLNGGPGSIGQAFVHERWASDPDLVRLAGWWGNDPATRFDVAEAFVPRPGAASWQASNPAVLAMAPLRASLAMFDEVGMAALRERSVRLTGALQALLDAIPGVETITPRDPAARGAMLSLRVRTRPRELFAALSERGVILDYREPGILRLAPAPLYNTFHEAWRISRIVAEAMA